MFLPCLSHLQCLTVLSVNKLIEIEFLSNHSKSYLQAQDKQTLVSIIHISQPLRMAASLWYIRMENNFSVPNCCSLECIVNWKSFGY